MNNCPNCGSNTNPGDAFCNVCGTNLSLPQNNSLNNPQVNNQIQNSVQIQGLQQMPSSNNTIGSQNDMEVLVDAYIGKNADKIKNGKFSFCSFFFGVIYVFYRKMWSVGLKWLVINIIIGGISSTAIWSAINMIQSGIIDISIVPIIFANVIIATQFMWIIHSVFIMAGGGISLLYVLLIATNINIAIKFKTMYLQNAVKNVNKIVADNPDKTKEQLIMLCKRKGGTNIIPVIVIIVTFVSLLIYIIVLINTLFRYY